MGRKIGSAELARIREMRETIRKGREQRARLEYGPRPAPAWNNSKVGDLGK